MVSKQRGESMRKQKNGSRSIPDRETPQELPIRIRFQAGVCRSVMLEFASEVLKTSLRRLIRAMKINHRPSYIFDLDVPGFLSSRDELRFCKMMRLNKPDGVFDIETFENMSYAFLEQAVKPAPRHWRSKATTNKTRAEVQQTLKYSRFSQRICPQCLREAQIFPICWRTPWLFACTKHQLLLVDTCPRCDHPIASERRLTRVAKTKLCDNHPSNQRRCTQELSEIATVDLSELPRIISAQNVIEGILAGQKPTMLGVVRQPLEALTILFEIMNWLPLLQPVDLSNVEPLLTAVQQYRARQHQDLAGRIENEEARERLRLHRASTMVWAALLPTAFSLIELPSQQHLEHHLFTLTKDLPTEDVVYFIRQLRRNQQQDRQAVLIVVIEELIFQLRHHFQLWDE